MVFKPDLEQPDVLDLPCIYCNEKGGESISYSFKSTLKRGVYRRWHTKCAERANPEYMAALAELTQKA